MGNCALLKVHGVQGSGELRTPHGARSECALLKVHGVNVRARVRMHVDVRRWKQVSLSLQNASLCPPRLALPLPQAAGVPRATRPSATACTALHTWRCHALRENHLWHRFWPRRRTGPTIRPNRQRPG